MNEVLGDLSLLNAVIGGAVLTLLRGVAARTAGLAFRG